MRFEVRMRCMEIFVFRSRLFKFLKKVVCISDPLSVTTKVKKESLSYTRTFNSCCLKFWQLLECVSFNPPLTKNLPRSQPVNQGCREISLSLLSGILSSACTATWIVPEAENDFRFHVSSLLLITKQYFFDIYTTKYQLHLNPINVLFKI